MSELVAVVIGAIAAGLIQTIIGVYERVRETESMLVAIASEVDAICRLIRHREYGVAVSAAAEEIRQGNWDGGSLVIDIRSDYFAVFHANSANIGRLKPHQASLIVNFYAYCKSAIDSTRPDGPFATVQYHQGAAGNIVELEAIFHSILYLGDKIVSLPKKPLALAGEG